MRFTLLWFVFLCMFSLNVPASENRSKIRAWSKSLDKKESKETTCQGAGTTEKCSAQQKESTSNVDKKDEQKDANK